MDEETRKRLLMQENMVTTDYGDPVSPDSMVLSGDITTPSLGMANAAISKGKAVFEKLMQLFPDNPTKVAEQMKRWEMLQKAKQTPEMLRRETQAAEAASAFSKKPIVDSTVHDASSIRKLPRMEQTARKDSGLQDERIADLLKRQSRRPLGE